MDFSIKTGEELFQLMLIAVLMLFTIVLLFVVLNIFMVLKRITNQANGVETPSFSLQNWWKSFAGTTVTVETEETILLDHNYDGIRELDNHLPPWWLGLFYGGIVFGIIYILNYHVWQWSPLQEEEYTIEVAEAQKKAEEFQSKMANSIDESSVKLVTDAAALAKGKEIYTGKCVACHGTAGEGGVGPNLTDEFWLHGGDVKSVFKTLKYGVPEKGMIAWQSQIKPNEMQDLAGYILSLQGTKPANAKEPQGDLFKPEASAATTPADSSKTTGVTP